jgi:hypothetical protein
MAGLRWWDGSAWQVLLGGPPTYAFIGPDAPLDPPDGMLWVQPVNPIVDLMSPLVLTEPSVWTWAGFGYGYPGLDFVADLDGMRVNWNPAPAQNPTAGQLGCASISGEAFVGHQMLAQMSVIVPSGSADVRLTHAFTSSSAWVTEKDTEVTISLPFVWTAGMNKYIGPESIPAPPGGHVIVTDIHLYDLTSSPPSPLRVWSATYNLWLPINDGLVQRAGDRMIGSLRFDTVDAETGQPTVTGLPTPVDDSDAVPLGFLNSVIEGLPDPGTGTGGGATMVVDDTAPLDPDVGQEWWDTATIYQEPFIVVVDGEQVAVATLGPTSWSQPAWDKVSIEIPCDGVLEVTHRVFGRHTTAGALIASRMDVESVDGLTCTPLGSPGMNQGRAVQAIASNVQNHSLVGFYTFTLTGVQPGASMLMAWYLYQAVAGGTFYTPYATIKFTPYISDRVTTVVMGSGSTAGVVIPPQPA